MIQIRKRHQQWFRGKFSWLFYSLICVVLLGILWGCGKLSDDTGRPSTPVGTSGGSPVNGGPKDVVGTYTLTLAANPNSIPADATNFSVLSATLSDTSGRSVQGYTVNFATSGNIGWFSDPTGSLVSVDESFTDNDGVATTRFYGTQSGEATVTATVDLNSDGAVDLTATKVVALTPSGDPSSAGTYTLKVWTNPTTVPADMATYATVIATVTDSSGGSVDGLTITFKSELGYVHNDPTPPSSPSTTATAVTNSNGSVSIYYYGDRAGSAVITASVSPPDLIGTLVDTTVIRVTEGPGEPGDGVAGLAVDVTPQVQTADADPKTGLADSEAVTLEVDVWDATGDLVGPGVRVEFTGDVTGYATTNESGTATLEFDPGKLYIGTYTYNVHVCTYSILPDQEQYCKDVSFSVIVLPPDLEVEARVIPSSVEIGQPGVILVTVTFLNAPVEGASVTYQAGGLITPASGAATLTNNAGIATFNFSGGIEGSDTVVANVQVTINGSFLTGSAEATVAVTAITITPTPTP